MATPESAKGLALIIIMILVVPESSFAFSVTGFLSDPLKLDSSSKRISASLDRSLRQLAAIQDETDADVREYLEQIEEIVRSFNSEIRAGIADIDQIVAKAISKAEQLEQQIYKDAVKLIWRAQCAAEVTLTDSLQRGLADAINSIRRADPSFKILGVPIGRAEVKPVDVPDPDLAYRAIKRKYLERLNKVDEFDDPYVFISTYSNLARLARQTRCHYLGQSAGDLFVRDFFEFERLAAPWKDIVQL